MMEKEIDIAKGDRSLADIESSAQSKDIFAEMQESIKKLCKGLLINSQKFDAEKWLSELKDYIKSYDRLLYSTISNIIFELSEEQFGIFMTNLDSVVEAVMQPSTTQAITGQQKKVVLKFYDHANLAHCQFVMFSNRKEEIGQIIDSKIAPAVTKITREMTSQLVGLVALFTALAFIVFGGITSLNGILESVQKINSTLQTVISFLLWTFAMLNFLFAFMYFVMRIVGCYHKSYSARNIVQRHPFICVCDGLLFSVILLCCGFLFAKEHGIGSFFILYLTSHEKETFWIGLIVILLIIILVWHLIRSKYREGKT